LALELVSFIPQSTGEMMSEIKIEQNPAEKKLNGLGVKDWPLWTKEVSQFPWTYVEAEPAISLRGKSPSPQRMENL